MRAYSLACTHHAGGQRCSPLSDREYQLWSIWNHWHWLASSRLNFGIFQWLMQPTHARTHARINGSGAIVVVRWQQEISREISFLVHFLLKAHYIHEMHNIGCVPLYACNALEIISFLLFKILNKNELMPTSVASVKWNALIDCVREARYQRYCVILSLFH